MAEPSSSIPDLLEKTLSKITESETQTPVTIPSPDCPGQGPATPRQGDVLRDTVLRFEIGEHFPPPAQ